MQSEALLILYFDKAVEGIAMQIHGPLFSTPMLS